MTKVTKSDDAVIVVLPCIHAPLTPKKVWSWAMTQLQNVADEHEITHVVQPGDWIDLEAASKFPDEHEHDQAYEYKVAARQSRDIRKIVGSKARLIRHDGNHEYRLEPGSTNPVAKRLARLTHWTRDKELSKEWGHWWWVPYHRSLKGITRIGNVAIWHGFDCGDQSDELEAIEVANLCNGHPHLLMVRAHTHRPLDVTQCNKTKKVPLPWWYMNAGHLGPSHPHYMRKDKTLGWGQGLAVIRAKTKLALDGVNWEAELRRFEGDTGETDPFLKQGIHPHQLEDELEEAISVLTEKPAAKRGRRN